MKNKFLNFLLICFIGLTQINFSNAEDQFIFDVTEIEIVENGNLIIGSKNGKAITEDGFEILGKNFVYNKSKNILNISGNVKFFDQENETEIFTDKATYLKNDEIILTEGNSRAINENNILTGANFKFDKIKNILTADTNVKFFDQENETEIFTDKATYLKNDEIILTEGKTSGKIDNKYKFSSKNLRYFKKDQILESKHKSSITDNNNIYKLDTFNYKIDEKFLKGTNVNLFIKVEEKRFDNYFFKNGFFNLDTGSFSAKNTKVKIHKDIFNNEEQDPRIYGISSKGNEAITVLEKGIFTSCKINDNCPPWSMQAKTITHDKIKKNLIYDNALLKVYNFPVFYFPKFFHPDPTVDRRTGFLQPQLNNSKTLGSSIYLPYFKTLGVNKDYTFKPTIFEKKSDKNKLLMQNEYRQKNKDSSLIADFALLKGYKETSSNKTKNVNHFFLNYSKDLNLKKFVNSNLGLTIQRVNNDTYLKVFQNNLFASPVMPNDKNLMQSKLSYNFEHENYNFSTNFQIYENLGKEQSDRYQYILPSYNFDRNLQPKKLKGSLTFNSSGSNNLINTNNLQTTVTNNLSYNSIDYYTNGGFKNNFSIHLKNLNKIAKKDATYKSSPSIDGSGIFETTTSFPLIKTSKLNEETLTPKFSFRLNPFDKMNNKSSSIRKISTDNIFNINRLGLSDTFEAGKSLTLGIDYKYDIKELDENQNNKKILKDKYLELKLATAFRDSNENKIPLSSTLDKKNSNLFGEINNHLFENFDIGYNFSIDNNFKTFESHSINPKITINNFVTEFSYLEERGNIGTQHTYSNKTTYNINDNNSFSFFTRRNKNISLTEFYDLIYEYKNDCLTAGIKYNRTFYQDNDLVPSENLFLTVTFIPLTTYERTLYERDKHGN